jgi:hypothetical protein
VQLHYSVLFDPASNTINDILARPVYGVYTETGDKFMRQTFQISFLDASKPQDNATTIYQRSGTPGYIGGRHVVVGQLLTQDSKYLFFWLWFHSMDM